MCICKVAGVSRDLRWLVQERKSRELRRVRVLYRSSSGSSGGTIGGQRYVIKVQEAGLRGCEGGAGGGEAKGSEQFPPTRKLLPLQERGIDCG